MKESCATLRGQQYVGTHLTGTFGLIRAIREPIRDD